MLVFQEPDKRRYQIKAYDEHSIEIGGMRYTETLIITPQELITTGLPSTYQDLTWEHVQPLLNQSPDILLIGTESQARALPTFLIEKLAQQQIGVECMSMKAACRSYMALCADDRNIAAILFIR